MRQIKNLAKSLFSELHLFVDLHQNKGRIATNPAPIACGWEVKTVPLHPAIVMIALLFIRLVVIIFKVKIMLLDFQTTVMLASVAVATVLSIYTLTQTNVR